jgi:hypothetical protein
LPRKPAPALAVIVVAFLAMFIARFYTSSPERRDMDDRQRWNGPEPG